MWPVKKLKIMNLQDDVADCAEAWVTSGEELDVLYSRESYPIAMVKIRPSVRFGVFNADFKTGELRKSGRKVRLQDQPFRVLAALLEKPGELVSREELKDQIWPEDTLIDFDHALTTAVKKLRRVLHDSATQPRYVETLPKRGYRFIAPVQMLNGSEPAAVVPEIGDSADARSLSVQRNVLAACLLVAGLAAILLWLRSSDPPESHARHFTFSPSIRDGSPRRAAAISPNGRNIVIVGPNALWIRDLADTELRMLPGTEGARAPFWSADSEFIAFGTPTALKMTSLHGGAPQDICELPGGLYYGGAWSSDGRWLMFSTGTPPALYRIPAEGGNPERLFEPVVTEGGGANYDVSFLPDDIRKDTILFMAGGPADRELIVRDLHSGEQRFLGRGLRPVYSRRGYVIYQAFGEEGGLWALPFDARNLEATGPAEPIAEGVVEPSLSDDATLVFLDLTQNVRSQQLVIRSRSGELETTIGELQDSVSVPSFSNDEKRVVASGAQQGERDIWVYELPGGTRSRVTSETAVEGDALWSPNNAQIVYRSDRTAQTELLMVDADRPSQPTVLPAKGLAKRPTDWSADGRFIVYSASGTETIMDLWLLELRAGSVAGDAKPLVQTQFQELNGQISPDGRLLAYCSDESGRFEVYVTPFPDANRRWQVSTEGACQPKWTRGGRELLYVSRDRLMAAELDPDAAEFQILAREELFRDRELVSGFPTRASYDVSTAGDRIVMRRTERESADEPVSVHVVENWWTVFRDRLVP
jgi:eukaryotic-like serine/threonine-protein kinase